MTVAAVIDYFFIKKWLILKIYKDGKTSSPLILMSSYETLPNYFLKKRHYDAMELRTIFFNVLHVYLPLSSSPGMTISYFCHDAKRRGGGGPRLNVIMMLITKKSLEVSPYT